MTVRINIWRLFYETTICYRPVGLRSAGRYLMLWTTFLF